MTNLVKSSPDRQVQKKPTAASEVKEKLMSKCTYSSVGELYKQFYRY